MPSLSTSQILVARALLKCGNVGWVWVVPCCPCCQGEHWHSGGALHDDPYRFVGSAHPRLCEVANLRAAGRATTEHPFMYLLQPSEQTLESSPRYRHDMQRQG